VNRAIKSKDKVENPYLDEFRKITGGTVDDLVSHMRTFESRKDLCHKYAWAIPTAEALQLLVKSSPIIEIGAGAGYWAFLAQQMGADIFCFDKLPPTKGSIKNHFHPNMEPYVPVFEGGPEKLLKYPERILFMCWPPYSDPMAHECLKNYRGNRILYVGEGGGGCTGDGAFWERIDKEWDEGDSIMIPQWFGINDYMCVFTRKETQHERPNKKRLFS
jgi:hypothetical protein